LDQEHRRFQDERERLTAMIREFKQRSIYNDKFATKAASTEKRLERFERDSAPPERARPQDVKMRLQGGRTGKIALRATALEIPGMVRPFDVELYFGERVAVVGSNGTGKSHFLRLLAGEDIEHCGTWSLGARVTPGFFSQTHDHPELSHVELLEVMAKTGLRIEQAMPALKRYELQGAARTYFSVLSGGQQARFQILMLEMASPTMLLLDEPTDNLDVDSAEALEQGLAGYEGTVVTVTHDRWFMRSMDRFLVFGSDGAVQERIDSPYLFDTHA
ncbi:MAG: ATP-binding cassette domain-containing protein, partial [Actinomycetota bacterium]|nr:ATP-binding cassette domain-containing protein [Actinomycetota bacterium]